MTNIYQVYSDERISGTLKYVATFRNLQDAEICAMQRVDYYGALITKVVEVAL